MAPPPKAKAGPPSGDQVNDQGTLDTSGNTPRGPSLGLPPVPRYDDDGSRISNSYKTLGLEHLVGKTRCTTLKFRISLITSCNADEYPHLRMSQVSGERIDMMLFESGKILPDTKPSNLGAATKRDARLAIRKQFEVRLSRGRNRFDEIAEDFSNLPMIAVRNGYPLSFCTPETRQLLAAHGFTGAQIPMSLTDHTVAPPQQGIALPNVASPLELTIGDQVSPKALMDRPSTAPPSTKTASKAVTGKAKSPSSPLVLALANVSQAQAASDILTGGAAPAVPVAAADAHSDSLGEPPKKLARLELPKLNLPCLARPSLETSALRRRREQNDDSASASGQGKEE